MTIALLSVCSVGSGQTFQKTFQGWWASTGWTFEFNSDGTYSRISAGHYGHTTVNGRYKINGDTIQLLNGFKETHGTVNEKYLIENDTIIIDLYLRYDYLQKDAFQHSYYQSRKREIKYPQTKTIYYNKKLELETVLNLAFNSDEMAKYYHFKDFLDRQLLIEKYYCLVADIKVGTQSSIYKSREEMPDKFYIEFEDINLNENSIDINVKLHGEGVRVWFSFKKVDGNWIGLKPHVIEN